MKLNFNLLKIVHVNNAFPGIGTAASVLQLNKALRKIGVDSVLLSHELSSNDDGIVPLESSKLFTAKLKAFQLLEKTMVLPHKKKSVQSGEFTKASFGVDISDHPEFQDADIIHLHEIHDGFLSLKGLQKLLEKGKPVVWTLYDMWPFTGGCHFAGTCLEFLEKCAFCPYLLKPGKNDIAARQFIFKKRLYSKVNIFPVAGSRWLRSLSSESSLFRNKHIDVIPQPVDVEYFKIMDKKSSREVLGLPQDKKLLLFCASGISDLKKGARYLIEALNILIDSFPVFKENVELVVTGKIPPGVKNNIPLRIRKINRNAGDDTDVLTFNAADAFVLPSVQEIMPSIITDAMSCGTPVIAFRTGSMPDVIMHKQSGFLAEIKNSLSLATGIYETLFLSDLEEMGKVAREIILKEFAEDVVAKKYLDVYENILNSR